MAVRLIGISGMSDEEYTDIRELLDKERIPYYVTPRGNWGLSMEAIWLKNNKDLRFAYNILNQYYHSKNLEFSLKKRLMSKNMGLIEKLLANPNVMAFYLPTLIIVLVMILLLT